MTSTERAQRTSDADALCAAAWAECGGPDAGAALVAVGGYGRGELAPWSDLDVVLVHDDDVALGELTERVWYPIWDSGVRLDHSVRSLPEMLDAASDLRVALGLLDARHVAGDPHLTLRLRTTMLADWRRQARSRLPELRRMVRARHELVGELAHLSVPDLKEAEGGLRDATVLKALVATWLVDVPHADLERSRWALLDVRDVVHEVSGRAGDRIGPEVWQDLAPALGLPDAVAAHRHVRRLGRRVAHLSRLTWRRVDALLDRPAGPRPRRPELVPVARGVALSGAEVVLGRDARPEDDPVLLLRAAAAASARDLVLAPATAARLARESSRLPDPWPAEARDQLVRLLAGPGLLGVWETLDETGALDLVLPEWERIRLLPHASSIHRFTVDRHVVETCREASALIRTVSRPDLLLVGALLHDIGKGGPAEHSIAGEPLARRIAERMGLAPGDVEVVGRLVRWHLLLSETATTRDPADPATAEHVVRRVRDAPTLRLLAALTEADARATSTHAWSTWRAGLVAEVVARAARLLEGRPAEGPWATEEAGAEPVLGPDGVEVVVEQVADGCRVRVAAPDRVGLLADVAATLALVRAPVRAARAWSQGELGLSSWELAVDTLDAAVVRERLAAVVEGRVDPRSRLRLLGPDDLEPVVVVRGGASREATVLEVRAADRPGVVHAVCAALAGLDLSVRSAHVDTLGPQAVDVFYVQEASAGALGDERAAAAAHAVRAALTGRAPDALN